MHLVVRGADNGIYPTTDWSGWTKIPGTTISCPGLTEYYYVGLELVYQDSSNRIWYDFWSKGAVGKKRYSLILTEVERARGICTHTSDGIYFRGWDGSWILCNNLPGGTSDRSHSIQFRLVT